MCLPECKQFPLRIALTVLAAALTLGACRSLPDKPVDPTGAIAPEPQQAVLAPPPALVIAPTPPLPGDQLRRGDWADLPDWRDDDLTAAWPALLASCSALQTQDAWRAVCTAALTESQVDRTRARRFFETHFTPYQLRNAQGSDRGLATGYYEPLLRGSRTPTARYRYPVYAVPDDLVAIDLLAFGIEATNTPPRARLDGRRVVPYFARAEIEAGLAQVHGWEIAWVDDPVELFFLQIQGSGRIDLTDGSVLRVGFADHNGHAYRSIGRLLIDRGELTPSQASMQGIKAWAHQHPGKLREVLDYNPRYIFFRELPEGLDGPLGALDVPLTARRSIAVDPRYVPLGAPVFLATTWPLSARPLNQLMLAQDTGTAIRGPVRADFFWGFGDDAGREAGRMKQSLRMWLLLPHNYPLSAAGSQ